MTKKELTEEWLREEEIAHIKGWDFSHIEDRYESDDDLPWDYRGVINQYLRPESEILDIDTGGGEFLLTLNHPNERLSATENYPPNVRYCKEVLLPLGIDFRQADGKGILPFKDGRFDMVIDRHGDYNAGEIWRVLKPGGMFITQQVGAENDRELVNLLLPEAVEVPFPDQYLEVAVKKFRDQGFEILHAQEAFRPIRFFDVGALVWFARVLPWEFPGFSVERCLEQLLTAQEQLERDGVLEGQIHRFLLVAKKTVSLG